MEMSNVIPIQKSRGKTETNKYRPISLLGIVSKVLEKHIHTKMLALLDSTRFCLITNGGFDLHTQLLLHLLQLLMIGLPPLILDLV